MALTINHNPMAMNTARSLNQHFGRLSTSTQRLSSGLRINSSADDAAGLAIRELQRSDIRTLRQGARNANDAISMLQTMDGGLSIIDEKLIRMKELAEQAATGTYDSTQRMMINDEFQAMKSEIDRIANATDFNNIKLLCPDIANKMFPGAVVNNVNPLLGENNITAEEFKILNPNAITSSVDNLTFKTFPTLDMISVGGSQAPYTMASHMGGIENVLTGEIFSDYKEYTIEYLPATNTAILHSGSNGPGEFFEYHDITVQIRAGGVTYFAIEGYADAAKTDVRYGLEIYSGHISHRYPSGIFEKDTLFTFINRPPAYDSKPFPESAEYPDAEIIEVRENTTSGPSYKTYAIDLDGDGIADIEQTFNANRINSQGPRIMDFSLNLSPPKSKIHFGTGNNSAEDYYYIDTKDCTARGLGIDRAVIDTQDAAQKNLTTLNSAIVKKDNARAYFGSMQNRLENTISNLNIQAENLQASESRISDTDVGIEMTEMVKNQILSQAATAMLAQANSIPKMALQVIGG